MYSTWFSQGFCKISQGKEPSPEVVNHQFLLKYLISDSYPAIYPHAHTHIHINIYMCTCIHTHMHTYILVQIFASHSGNQSDFNTSIVSLLILNAPLGYLDYITLTFLQAQVNSQNQGNPELRTCPEIVMFRQPSSC